jgi:predicted O-methyltransferase YrrM
MISKLVHRISSALGTDGTEKLSRMNFQSGLGDSAWLLYGICRSLKPQVAVEIGSARGKSACYVGTALKQNGSGHLYAVDPHTTTSWNDSNSVNTFDIMRANLAALDLNDTVTILRQFSDVAIESVPKPIDMIFIDGDHTYEGVKADWDLYTPHMSQFGWVVFHDTLWDIRPDPRWQRDDMGVPRFVEELRKSGYPVLTIDKDFGVSLVQTTRGGIPLSS